MRSEFGSRLLAARKFANLTQDQLCAKTGIGQSNLGKLEKTGQGSSYTPAIAEACKVNIHWLAYGTGDMKAPDAPIYSGPSERASNIAFMFDKLPPSVQVQLSGAILEMIVRAMQSIPAQAEPGQPKNTPVQSHT